jgi:hypothetical protein
MKIVHCFCKFGCGRYEVHVDALTHPSNLGMRAWFIIATGNDLDDTMERATH